MTRAGRKPPARPRAAEAARSRAPGDLVSTTRRTTRASSRCSGTTGGSPSRARRRSPAAGDYRVVELGTQSIFVVRAEDGGLRAFHNTCRHRGSILCTAAQGSFARSRIVCPYHAWTYDLGGRLIATPRRMPTPDFDPTKLSLHEVAVAAWGGFVFIHLAGREAPPLAESLGELPERFARYGFGGLRIGKRIVADVQANWKLIAENFSECFHCPPVHPELCRIVTAYRDAGAWGLHRDERGAPCRRPRPNTRRARRPSRSTARRRSRHSGV